jgi:hypothetical protein
MCHLIIDLQFFLQDSTQIYKRATMYEESSFKLNDRCHGHSHGIVCSNDPILCKTIRLRIKNNVAEESFHFLCTKNSFFSFSECHKSKFCEGPTKIQFDNCKKTISKIIGTFRVYNSALV